jgi:F-type H+-transporting ATPase subunit b
MLLTTLASETVSSSDASPLDALGVNAKTFLVQLITFILVFYLLRRFAFNKIVNVLEKRRLVIDEGVRLGQEMAEQKARMEEDAAKVMADARHAADGVLAAAHKEGRELVRQAEKAAHQKSKITLEEAQVRIDHETHLAKRKLEKELAGIVVEATEAVVGQKIDANKDSKMIETAIRERLKA